MDQALWFDKVLCLGRKSRVTSLWKLATLINGWP